MSKDSRTGRQWVSGGNAPFRDDLVAWPMPATEVKSPEAPTAPPPTAPDGDADLTPEELRAELAEARSLIRRLLTRIELLEKEKR